MVIYMPINIPSNNLLQARDFVSGGFAATCQLVREKYSHELEKEPEEETVFALRELLNFYSILRVYLIVAKLSETEKSEVLRLFRKRLYAYLDSRQEMERASQLFTSHMPQS